MLALYAYIFISVLRIWKDGPHVRKLLCSHCPLFILLIFLHHQNRNIYIDFFIPNARSYRVSPTSSGSWDCVVSSVIGGLWKSFHFSCVIKEKFLVVKFYEAFSCTQETWFLCHIKEGHPTVIFKIFSLSNTFRKVQRFFSSCALIGCGVFSSIFHHLCRLSWDFHRRFFHHSTPYFCLRRKKPVDEIDIMTNEETMKFSFFPQEFPYYPIPQFSTTMKMRK